MKKIKALHEFLVGLDLFAAEQMDSFVDQLTISPACRQCATPGQLVVAEQDYTATFYIERYPHALHPAEYLVAQLSVWLLQHDPERLDKKQIAVTVEVLDSSTASIEFSIEFNELVYAQAQANGGIVFNNIAYALVP
jgi:hypothetical protein